MRILLVEDDRDLAANLVEWLSHHNASVDYAFCGGDAIALLEKDEFDVVILDWQLPDMQGIQVVTTLRQQLSNNTPVLMLTARDTLADKLKGFESGADDYLVKPFEMEELLARIQAMTRRGPSPVIKDLTIADIKYDTQTRIATRGGAELKLSPTARKLLQHLIVNQHRIVTRNEIVDLLWGDNEPDSDALKVHIHAIRQQVDGDRTTPLLKTHRGVGYQLCVSQ